MAPHIVVEAGAPDIDKMARPWEQAHPFAASVGAACSPAYTADSSPLADAAEHIHILVASVDRSAVDREVDST